MAMPQNLKLTESNYQTRKKLCSKELDLTKMKMKLPASRRLTKDAGEYVSKFNGVEDPKYNAIHKHFARVQLE